MYLNKENLFLMELLIVAQYRGTEEPDKNFFINTRVHFSGTILP